MTPKYFKTQNDLRRWFEKNHNKITEQWIGFYKKYSGKKSITWSESVDQALCFGWIDGIRKSIDDERYMIRFTPRKPTSNWSAVNIKKIEELSQKGLMKSEGIEAFEKRKESKSRIYSYEQSEIKLEKKHEKLISVNKSAWEYFNNEMAASYKTASIRWVTSAKREETKLRRLNILIQSSAKKELVPLLTKYKKK